MVQMSLPTTYRRPLPTTYRPRTDHISTTYRPSLPTTYWPHTDRSTCCYCLCWKWDFAADRDRADDKTGRPGVPVQWIGSDSGAKWCPWTTSMVSESGNPSNGDWGERVTTRRGQSGNAYVMKNAPHVKVEFLADVRIRDDFNVWLNGNSTANEVITDPKIC